MHKFAIRCVRQTAARIGAGSPSLIHVALSRI
jgi:hypothetical protein